MAIPLVMLGPGGDFVTRFDVKGHDLLKSVGQSLGQQPDTETAGSFSGYSRMPKRGSAQAASRSASVGEQGPIARSPDVFEHIAPRLALPLYRPHLAATRQAAGLSSDSALASMVHAIDSWLAAQQRALLELSRSLLATLPLSAARPAATPSPAPAASRSIPFRRVSLYDRIARPAQPHGAAEARATAASAPFSEASHESDSQAAPHSHPGPRPAHGTRLFTDYAGVGGRTGREQGDGLRARRGPDQKRRALQTAQQGTLFGA